MLEKLSRDVYLINDTRSKIWKDLMQQNCCSNHIFGFHIFLIKFLPTSICLTSERNQIIVFRVLTFGKDNRFCSKYFLRQMKNCTLGSKEFNYVKLRFQQFSAVYLCQPFGFYLQPCCSLIVHITNFFQQSTHTVPYNYYFHRHLISVKYVLVLLLCFQLTLI